MPSPLEVSALTIPSRYVPWSGESATLQQVNLVPTISHSSKSCISFNNDFRTDKAKVED